MALRSSYSGCRRTASPGIFFRPVGGRRCRRQPAVRRSIEYPPRLAPKPRFVDLPMDIAKLFTPHRDVLSSAVLADVLDALGHATSALPAAIRPLRPQWKLFGRAATLSAVSVGGVPAKPYAVELECVDALRPGEVLVATTNGDRSSALWGELL